MDQNATKLQAGAMSGTGLWRLAWRNLTRNRRRSLITISAISLGLALMIFSFNIGQSMYQKMIQQGISTMAGHVVVQGAGFQEERETDVVVSDPEGAKSALQSASPDGVVTSRSFVQGLLTSPDNAVGVMLTAVEPSLEAQVSSWDEKIVEGAWLEDDDGRGILLGARLAEVLDVKVGSKVVLMAQQIHTNEVTSRMFRVRGLIKTGNAELDGFGAVIPLAATMEFMGLESEDAPLPVHQVSLHLSDIDTLNESLASARTSLTNGEKSGDGVEVLGWSEALPEVAEFIQMDRGFNNMFFFVIGIIVTFGLVNTVLMSVLERVREFGVMLALGLSPARLAKLVMCEGLVLGVTATLIGVGLGMLVSWPVAVYGIDLTSMAGEQFDMGSVSVGAVLYAEPDWSRIIGTSILAVVLTVLAAVYPAYRVTRIDPAEAMRHV